MIDLPYIFFRCAKGTLPGRKPLIRDLGLGVGETLVHS